MKINISIETDYNIGDKVYVISEVPKFNNLYKDEIKWIVETDDLDGRKYEPFKIKGRIIEQYEEKPKVFYNIHHGLHTETSIFKDLDSALEECKRRNGDN